MTHLDSPAGTELALLLGVGVQTSGSTEVQPLGAGSITNSSDTFYCEALCRYRDALPAQGSLCSYETLQRIESEGLPRDAPEVRTLRHLATSILPQCVRIVRRGDLPTILIEGAEPTTPQLDIP